MQLQSWVGGLGKFDIYECELLGSEPFQHIYPVLTVCTDTGCQFRLDKISFKTFFKIYRAWLLRITTRNKEKDSKVRTGLQSSLIVLIVDPSSQFIKGEYSPVGITSIIFLKHYLDNV